MIVNNVVITWRLFKVGFQFTELMSCEIIKSDLQTKSLLFGLGSFPILPHTFSFLSPGCWIVKILEVSCFFE